MSAPVQGFVAGALVGGFCYLSAYSNLWAQYEGVGRDFSRFNLAINPKHIVDQHKITEIPVERDWVVSAPTDTQQSAGRRPSDTWNMSVGLVYKQFALRFLSNPTHVQ